MLGHLLFEAIEVDLFAIAKALLVEAGVDARPQQHRIEGLGQVVLGARLDTADDAVDLVDGRDHDHRHPVHPRVGLEARQHLEAVHVRHHQVEEDQIEILGLHLRQRLAPAIGRADAMAEADAPPGEQIAVGLDVVALETMPGCRPRRRRACVRCGCPSPSARNR